MSFGIFTQRWNRGFELSAEALHGIQSIGAGVGFDIYANLEDDDGYHRVGFDEYAEGVH
jgi:hypothetical protein